MKAITNINWVLIGLYGLLLVFTLFNLNRSGNDAAGQGMESGFLLIGVILLAALIGLNVMPYAWSKITALLIQVLLLVIVLYNMVSNFFDSSQHR